MSVAMVVVLVVLLIARVARAVVIRVRAFMMVMIMGMEARGSDALSHVPMQGGGRTTVDKDRRSGVKKTFMNRPQGAVGSFWWRWRGPGLPAD